MSDTTYPVMIRTKAGAVRVGTLTKASDGLFLDLGEMVLGDALPASAPAPARPAAPPPAPATRPTGPLPTNFPNYGRGKNGPIADATREDLDYYAAGARRSIADPAKSNWHAKEQALLAAIEAEIARQSAPAARPSFMSAPSQPSMFRDEPPSPSDDDIPF